MPVALAGSVAQAEWVAPVGPVESVVQVESAAWVVLAELAAWVESVVQAEWVAVETRSIRSAAEETAGATIHNIAVGHPIVIAQQPTVSVAQHAENPLQTGRQAPGIRFQGRAEIFRVIEPVTEPGQVQAQGVPAEAVGQRGLQAALVREALVLAELTRLAAEISPGILPAADQHSGAATTTERRRGPAALAAAAASAVEAVVVAEEAEAAAEGDRGRRRKDRTQNETCTNSNCQRLAPDCVELRRFSAARIICSADATTKATGDAATSGGRRSTRLRDTTTGWQSSSGCCEKL